MRTPQTRLALGSEKGGVVGEESVTVAGESGRRDGVVAVAIGD
jgi:hypothetical protein